jgi:hypothetical protein
MQLKYDSSAYSSVDVSIITPSSGLNTGTGTLTSSSTGDNINDTITTSANYTNLATCNLGNNLLDDLIKNDKNQDTEINISFTTTTITNIITTKKHDFNPINNYVPGFTYNVDKFYKFLNKFINNQDAYSENSTVTYFATYFYGITSNQLNVLLPLIHIGPNDFITYEITVPEKKWLSEHNLFNTTPYFYSYNKDGTVTDVWASVDITIRLFDQFKISGNKIKICMTSSKTVGDKYKSEGYIISKIPSEFLNSCTFFPLIRIGCLKKNDTYDINNFVKSYYYKSDDPTIKNNYTSSEIIAAFPPELSPSDPIFFENLTKYNNIVSYLNNYLCDSSLTYQLFKYLSNFYNTSYALTNFYRCISIDPPGQLEGNNTGESYANSNIINLSSVKQHYIYILALNQNKMKIGLTSNVQVYDSVTIDVIANGTIYTSPSIPAMSSKNYPNIKINNMPLFSLTAINVPELLTTGITSIIIGERIAYEPNNYYQPPDEYTGKAYILFGPELSEDNISYLKKNYDISISYLNE